MKLEELFPGETELPGYSIELIELDDEIHTRDITFDLWEQAECNMGEDILDQYSLDLKNSYIASGFIAALYPELASLIYKKTNEKGKYFSIYDLEDLFEEYEQFINAFLKFINTTYYVKARYNHFIEQINMYYND